MNALLDTDRLNNYLLLDLQNNPDIQTTLAQMIVEFNQQRHLSNELMQSYVQTLFIQLSRIYHAQLNKIYATGSNIDIMITILQQIEEHYQDLSLNDLAQRLGYNRNYLSNLIKLKTHKTFSQLMNEARMLEAHKLILTTNIPIESIALHVGITNKSQFYRKFKEHYHDTPQNVRKMR